MGVGAILIAIGLTAGCVKSQPPADQEFTLNACGLLEAPTVEALIGEIASQEEPVLKDSLLRGSEPTCKYYPVDTSNSPLNIRINHGNENTVALMENATGCEESMPLAVDGAAGFLCADVGTGGLPGASVKATWGQHPTYFTSIYFVVDKEGQTFTQIAAPMQDAVKDLMKNVTEDSFTPQPLTP